VCPLKYKLSPENLDFENHIIFGFSAAKNKQKSGLRDGLWLSFQRLDGQYYGTFN
jgi:hypothetical protein